MFNWDLEYILAVSFSIVVWLTKFFRKALIFSYILWTFSIRAAWVLHICQSEIPSDSQQDWCWARWRFQSHRYKSGIAPLFCSHWKRIWPTFLSSLPLGNWPQNAPVLLWCDWHRSLRCDRTSAAVCTAPALTFLTLLQRVLIMLSEKNVLCTDYGY